MTSPPRIALALIREADQGRRHVVAQRFLIGRRDRIDAGQRFQVGHQPSSLASESSGLSVERGFERDEGHVPVFEARVDRVGGIQPAQHQSRRDHQHHAQRDLHADEVPRSRPPRRLRPAPAESCFMTACRFGLET